ncbi:MAG: hypothetical protein D6767_04095 [Candidatus Hydrogenedentota bacterium]|nr:MAG: hypothetical protein D6767_04095 [Candidatus Hydrogenedentota bacterium]
MHKSLCGTLSFFLLTTATLYAKDKIVYRATAYSKDRKKIYYYENHREIWQNGKHIASQVTYTDPKGKVIVKKRVDYSKSQTAPDFVTEDLRTGYMEGATLLPPGKVKLYFRRDKSAKLESDILRIKTPLVLDAGFDRFIRLKWKELQTGKKMRVFFAVPSRLTLLEFRLYKVKDTRYNGRSAVQYTLDLNNIFYRLFVKGFSLYYDKEKRRLLSFQGISNLRDEEGDNYETIIDFDPW